MISFQETTQEGADNNGGITYVIRRHLSGMAPAVHMRLSSELFIRVVGD